MKTYEDYLNEFKSLEEVDRQMFDKIQKTHNCELCDLDVNKYDPPKGKLCLTGTFRDKSQVKLMFIGLAPSYRRFDMKLRAFFPQDISEHSSGSLFLRSMIETKVVELFDVYITNIMKCSTVENSVPTESQIEDNSSVLMEEIELVKPNYIICLGKECFSYFTSKLAGAAKDLCSFEVLKLTHPSYFLRKGDQTGMTLEMYKMKLALLEGDETVKETVINNLGRYCNEQA